MTSCTDLSGNVGDRMHHHGVPDDPAPTTVRDRLAAAGLSDARVDEHLAAGRVRVDGELVTDLETPAPPPARVVVWDQ